MMRISYRTSRLLGVGLLLLLIVTISIFSYTIFTTTSEKLHNTIMVEEEKLSLWYEISRLMHESKFRLLEYVHDETEVLAPVLLLCERAQQSLDKLKKLSVGDSEEMEYIVEIEKLAKRYRQAVYSYKSEIDAGFEGGSTELQMRDIAIESGELIAGQTDVVVSHVNENMKSSSEKLIATAENGKTTLEIFIVVSICTAIVVAFRMQRSLVRPISDLLDGFKKISEGDFEHRLETKSNDEIGKLFRGFNSHVESLDDQRRLLRESLKTAEEASKAKGDFLANMSHEIRTPMNGVLGMAELLQATKLTSEQKRYTSTILNSGETLLHIINDILDFSKIEAGKVEVENIEFNLRNLIEDVAQLMSHRVHEKKLELSVLIEEGQDSVNYMGDPTKIRQVITNLVANAIKFTSQGEVLIRAKIRFLDDETDQLLVDVEDTGIGIPEEQIKELFAPFSQADSSTTRKYGGTGLGLTISRKLTRLMGGKLECQSRINHGSVFRFTSVLTKKNTQLRSILYHFSEMLRGKRVLIVDDNDNCIEALSYYFNFWGINSESAFTAYEGIYKIKTAAKKGLHFDVILIDLQMTDIDGGNLARTIREDLVLPDLRIIMLSSERILQEPTEFEELNISACLEKPYRLIDLHDLLVNSLNESHTKNISEEANLRAQISSSPHLGLNVLVAEDNETNQEVVVAMLKSFGCEVDVVGNGIEAVKNWESKIYDLVLMDCQMPVLDGYRATEKIRILEDQADTDTHTPIVALTAHALAADRNKCIASGMDFHLSKPFSKEKLYQVIRDSVLSQKIDRKDDGNKIVPIQKLGS